MPSENLNLIRRLAEIYGILPSYTDELGRSCQVSSRNLVRLLGVRGVRAGTTAQIRRSLAAAVTHDWLRILPPCLIVTAGKVPKTWTIHLPVSRQAARSMTLRWRIRDAIGDSRSRTIDKPTIEATKRIGDTPYVRLALPFPRDIAVGSYTMEVDAETDGRQWHDAMKVVVAPDRCYGPEDLSCARTSRRKHTKPVRVWGVSIQLYGLRSRRNWGIGDLRDLCDMTRWVAKLGAAMIGVNPLHAPPPGGTSPYSPSSRLFYNAWHLNVEGMAEFHHPDIQALVQSPRFQRRLGTLRATATVDYEGVFSVKRRVFERLYRVFLSTHMRQKTPRGVAFQRYIKQEGEALERFAIFQTLQEHFSGRTWQDWPVEYHRPDSAEVRQFLHEQQDRVNFYRYLQWQCDVQLHAVKETAHRAGMPIGLYLDFAVGIDPHGADAWSFQDQVASGASVGAPPDLFSPLGQNWGLSPPDPESLRDRCCTFLAEGFRRSTRHSGILRLDHAMGLFRLFWVPEGRPARDGAYVSYPADDLLGVLAIESRRNQTIVVGEDLGTVTPEIRRRLMKRGLLSYRLLLFEKSRHGFLPPHRYAEQAMASFTTHDLPTLAGFWAGRDIEIKERVGLYPDKTLADRDRNTRAHDRQALLNALARERLLPSGHAARAEGMKTVDTTVAAAVYRYLARTPSCLVAVPLEDLLGDVDTPNIPGANSNQYPVWRVKTGPPDSTLEDWGKLARVTAIARALNAERPRR